MSTARERSDSVRVSAEHIGGIDETVVELRRGVNVLAGRNATNRTSFLRSVMAALGSTDVTLKRDADEGRVELTIGEETYTRTLTRTTGGVQFGGDPFLDDPEIADLFAFLLENNAARAAVARDGDLRELIMRPVDTAQINREIQSLRDERDQIDAELEELDSLAERLPVLEERRNRRIDEIEETSEALSAKETEIEAADVDIHESREDRNELERHLNDLQSIRSDLETTRFELESERESLEALRREESTIADKLEALTDEPNGSVEEINSRLKRLRERKRTVDSTVSTLQSIIRFNTDLLEGGSSPEVLSSLSTDDTDVTDRLVGDEVRCWTCGTAVETNAIDEMVTDLQSVRKSQLEERNRLASEIKELQNERDEIEQSTKERRRMERKLDETRVEIETRESSIEKLGEHRSDLEARVDELEETIAALEDDSADMLLELHREANQLEFEIGRLEDDREAVVEEIQSVESRLESREHLETDRESVAEELADCRTKIEQIETDAVDAFNEHMAELLDVLGYENIERIWIERTERAVRQGRQHVTQGSFDLHIVRKTASGVAYEDTIANLSESEREVTGLVFALAGYLVHEVYDVVPFMLLDSLESIDSDRIAALVAYFNEYAPFVAVALLPEDAAAVEGDVQSIESI